MPAVRLTYGRPHEGHPSPDKEQPIEEEVYLGDLPIMLGGGEFIINGAERVVVSQLHRSPGVDFVVEMEGTEKRLHSCRIIPERGSWIEPERDSQGKPCRAHRSERQVLGLDTPSGHGCQVRPERRLAPRFLSDDRRDDRRRPQRGQDRGGGPAVTISSIPRTARGPARSWSKAGRRSPRMLPSRSARPG